MPVLMSALQPSSSNSAPLPIRQRNAVAPTTKISAKRDEGRLVTVADITSRCKDIQGKAFLMYERTPAGVMVTLRHESPGLKDKGAFFADFIEGGVGALAGRGGFAMRAANWGLSPRELAQFVFEYVGLA